MKKHVFALAIAALAVVGASAEPYDTLAKIKSKGEVTMGVRDSSGALAYTIGDSKYVGFHTEMAERIIADIQKQLGLPALKINRVLINSQNRVPLVTGHTIDFECGSTTNNLARQKDVAFAMTTYVEEVRIATKVKSGINSINDLNGKTIVTTTGTTSVQTLRKNERASGMDFKSVTGKDHADSMLLLESGRADAFVMDGQILAGNISRAKNPADFKIVGEALSVEPIACMMSKEDPAFKKAVDDSIKRQVADGSLAKLYDKWFMQPIPPTNTKVGLPLSEATKAAWASPNDKPMEEYVKK